MKIYGVALLAGCFLVGKVMGTLLGQLLNINSDVGGVGFAMFLLMATSIYFRKKGWLGEESEKGILFWSSIYIPIVVAMAATLNVKAAVSGGLVAIIAGVGVTSFCLLLVPMISKIGRNNEMES
jgi:malonate transporter MadL subunit